MVPHPPDPRSRPSSSQVPITSSWCRRALRPLTSIIVRLEKHWKAVPLESQECAPKILDCTLNTKPARLRRGPVRGRIDDGGCASDSSPEDPTWVPGRSGQTRVKHRYSGHRQSRGVGRSRVVPKSPEAEKLRPGEFTIATPLVLGEKGRKDQDDAEDGAAVTSGHDVGRCSIRTAQQNLPKRKLVPNSVEDLSRCDAGDQYRDQTYVNIVHGIVVVWNTFLRMTASQLDAPSGARSLMLMSLEKTSEYILHEQERLNALDDRDQDTDVADFIIAELESTYALSNRGWKPLKDLVRAHGIRMVYDAVRKKWISPILSRLLILNAMDGSFYDAAEALLSALLSVSPDITPPGRLDSPLFLLDNHTALNTLYIYTNRTGRQGFLFRELAMLVARGAVPVEWMATDDTKPVMASAIQSITSNNEYSTHSAQFVAAVMCAALGMKSFSDHSALLKVCRQVPTRQTRSFQARRKAERTNAMPRVRESGCDEFIFTALSNTISSVLTILSGAHFARFGHCHAAAGNSPMHTLISLVSTSIQQEIELKWMYESNESSSFLQSLRIGHVLMADYILTCATAGRRAITPAPEETFFPLTVGQSALDNFEYFLAQVSNRRELVSEFSLLVLQVSRCWGRTQGDDGFTKVKLLTETLVSTQPTSRTKQSPILQAVLNKVAVDVALNFAEFTCLPEHHAWALHVQEAVTATGVAITSDDDPSPWTPSLALSTTGFRWEDGIGEWVARTPLVVRQNRTRKVLGTVQPRPCSSFSRGASRSGHDASELSEDESGHERSSTPPSSVEDEGGVEGLHGNAPSEHESSPVFCRKRKLLPGEVLPGGNKRAKPSVETVSPTLRYGLRRRRTVSGCEIFHDSRHSDEANDWNREPSSHGCVPSSSEQPRPRSSNIEVAIMVSPAASTRKNKSMSPDVAVVIPNNNRYGRAAPGHKEMITPPSVDDSVGEEDDIFISAPVLRDRLGIGTGSRNVSSSSSSSSASRRDSRAGSMRRRLRSRRSLGQMTEVIRGSEESSDDELSFIG